MKTKNKKHYSYSPKYKWSKEKINVVDRIGVSLSEVSKKLIYRFTGFKVGFIDRNILEHREKLSNIYSKPDDVNLELLTLIVSWIVPVEKLDNVKNTFYKLRDNYPTYPYGDMGHGDLLELAFSYKQKKISHAGSSNIFGFDLSNGKYKYIDGIEQFVINYDLSSYCVINGVLNLSDKTKKMFNNIICYKHEDYSRIVFPWELKNNNGVSLHTTSGKEIKQKDLSNLINDIKWEANEFLMKYSDRNNFINIRPMPAMEVYKYSESDKESKQKNNFWKSVGMTRNHYLDFITENKSFHLFYPSFWENEFQEKKVVKDCFKILVDTNKLKKDDLHHSINSQIRFNVFNWSIYIGLLMQIDSIVNRIEKKLVKIRNLIYLTIENDSIKKIGQSDFKKVMNAKDKLFNLVVLLERLFADFNRLENNYFTDNLPNAIYTTSTISNEEIKLNLFKNIDDTIKKRLKSLKNHFKLIDELGKQKLEYQLMISNRNIALISILIAIVSLLFSVFNNGG